MGNLRKQTIISSILVYIGFLIGFINMYLYTKQGLFTPEQYALTQIFFDFAQIAFACGSLGVIPVVYKFYPYYKDNLPKNKIDILTWAMLIAFFGFLMILLAGWLFEPFFIQKFIENSSLVLDYYFWLFPFTMGMLFYSVTESFAWAVHRSVITNFLKETILRVLSLVLIALYFFRLISFNTFIYLFSFQYLAIFIILFVYLYRTGELHFNFSVSRVTRKYWKKMANMQALIWSGTFIAAISATIDTFIIASIFGLTSAGVFTFGRYAANLIQVPMRSINAVSAGILSKAWKDKNFPEINRIYYRSSINLLLISLFIFGNIWLNVQDGIDVLDIQNKYMEAMTVLLLLCVVRTIDAGTGLNALVIGTSTYWKFDFISGVCLLVLRLPLTYYLIKSYGIVGSAYAELISVSAINMVRYEFLRRKFGMSPFSIKTLYSVLLGVSAYFLTWLVFRNVHGWTGIFLKTGSFSGIMAAGIFYWKLTPDAAQLYEVFLNKLKRRAS